MISNPLYQLTRFFPQRSLVRRKKGGWSGAIDNFTQANGICFNRIEILVSLRPKVDIMIFLVIKKSPKSHWLPSGKLTSLAGISLLLIGNTSSKGPFSIAMLDYRSVVLWWASPAAHKRLEMVGHSKQLSCNFLDKQRTQATLSVWHCLQKKSPCPYARPSKRATTQITKKN